MALLTLRDVTVRYDNHVAVRNLSFTLEQGDYLLVVGENGSGKSTLMQAILGLLPVSSGQIVLHGLEHREIGYLPQQTVVQRDFPACVKEVVLSGCLNKRGLRPFYSAKEKRRMEENLERLQISELKNTSYRELSGGQQQRVLLARALCATERLLLLDEPVTGLDPVAASQMYELVAGLNRSGVTVIMVSHDLSGALHQAGKILQLDTDMVFFGTTDEYLQSDAGRKMLGRGGKND